MKTYKSTTVIITRIENKHREDMDSLSLSLSLSFCVILLNNIFLILDEQACLVIDFESVDDCLNENNEMIINDDGDCARFDSERRL